MMMSTSKRCFSSFSIARDDSTAVVLRKFRVYIKNRAKHHLGYPYNFKYKHDILHKFYRHSINNLGDPYTGSNYGVNSTTFEKEVIKFVCQIWKLPEADSWGCVTSCGSESNLLALHRAREQHPTGVVFMSADTHYSIQKAVKLLRMDCEVVDSSWNGEINYGELKSKLALQSSNAHIILVINIGTTVKGAFDNISIVLRIVKECGIKKENLYIHCDAAFSGLGIPLTSNASLHSFAYPIDSVAISGHKQLGCPVPAGIFISRTTSTIPEYIPYLNSVDTTISGSRNGHSVLHLWYQLRLMETTGILRQLQDCVTTARWLVNMLSIRSIRCFINTMSQTVVMERPLCSKFIRKWQLACDGDLSHVCITPGTHQETLRGFVREFESIRETNGVVRPGKTIYKLMGI
jgi:histidine decarboxylase